MATNEQPNDGNPATGTSRGEDARGSIYPALEAFATAQRTLAALDFSAFFEAQRALSQFTATASSIARAHEAIARGFGQSVDFAALIPAHHALADSAAMKDVVSAQAQWVEALTRAIDVSALGRINETLLSIGHLSPVIEANLSIFQSLQTRLSTAADFFQTFPIQPATFGPSLLVALRRWIPANLRDVDDLDRVAAIALDEGVPLTWIPRPAIVMELLDVASAGERLAILQARREEILEDCDAALAVVPHEWSRQCREATMALRMDLHGPAQSHAANIIDSLVLSLLGKDGRRLACEDAEQHLDDVPLQLAAENLSLRPLLRAFTHWWPSSGIEPPDHFARHATAHGVGHPAVFRPTTALVAVMLAVSLTVQYSPETDDSHASASG